MREINYTKSDARIKQVCRDAFNELQLPQYSTYIALTIRERVKLNTITKRVQNILGRL